MTTPPPFPSPLPAAPPVHAAPPRRLWRDGAALVVRRNTPLPTRHCLRCHDPAAGLSRIPGSAKDPFQVALCARHLRWIRWSPPVGSALAVVGASALVVGTSRGSLPAALFGFYVLISSIVVATMARGTLRTIGANAHFIRVRGVSVRLLKTLHGWNDYPQIPA